MIVKHFYIVFQEYILKNFVSNCENTMIWVYYNKHIIYLKVGNKNYVINYNLLNADQSKAQKDSWIEICILMLGVVLRKTNILKF